MARAPSDVSFAILAGGKGTRLGGVPKGLISIDGEPIIARLSRLAARFAETLIVTPDPEPYRFLDLRFVTSEQAGVGPMAGVLSAIEAARTPALILVACDMPFVTDPVLELLLQASGNACCFEVEGRLQPLPSLWERSALPQLHEALKETHSLTGVLMRLSATVLSESVLASADPKLQSVRSLNRIEDLTEVGARLPDVSPLSLP